MLATQNPPSHPCDHCGKTSPSNLRCSKCHSVWYCDRSCQSSAWNPPSTTNNVNNGHDVADEDGCMQGGSNGKHCGHREICRQICKTNRKKNKERNAFVELIQHAQNLDCNEAYRRMCLAQDEIQRMKSSVLVGELPQHQIMNDQQLHLQQHDANHTMDQTIQIENTTAGTNVNDGTNSCAVMTTNKLDELHMQSPLNPNEKIHHVPNIKSSSPTTVLYPHPRRVSGIWLEHGGKISIEYLPNVKCYRVVLLTSPHPTSSDTVGVDDLWTDFPKSQNELHYTIKPRIVTIDDGMHTHFEVKLYQCRHDAIVSSSSPLTLDRKERQTLLLSMTLPTPASHIGLAKEGESAAMLPNINISLDDNSISMRIQLMQNEDHATTAMTNNESEHLVDNLLGIDTTSSPSFSPHVGVTSAPDLNYLRCRSCQNRLLLPRDTSSSTTLASDIAVHNDAMTNQNDDTPHSSDIIQAVLPLPSGFWDDISDYLMCYDGQASVDFTSASTSAIARVALEDDAILVLHKSDLDDMGGICVIDALGGGYGESATMAKGYFGKHDEGSGGGDGGGGGGGVPFQAWRDRAAIQGMKSKTATCANCYSTLGYISERDNDTFRLYKHLLDCGKENDDDDGNDCGGTLLERGGAFFAKHTCASFLARELVRYAESDAIYTFIVTISDVNDWTRMGRNSPGACILLRTLGWDTPMSTVTGGKRLDVPPEGGGSGDMMNYPLSFQKIVKVIFEVATDRDIFTPFETGNGDNLMEWTWGGIDFCCPTPRMASSPNADSLIEDDEMAVQTRASSVGIFLSEREWCELKHTLHRSSDYFTDSVSDAIVMTKLGVLPNITNDRQQTARLSFLPLVTY